MRNWAGYWITSLLWIGALSLPALAFAPRAGKTVVVSEALQDDLYLAGGTVTTTAAVDGDVVATGGTVDLTGDVSGGVLAAGGTLTMSGAIGRSLRAAAGTVAINSRVKSDGILAGGNVRVDPAAQIGRDLVVQGGSVNVYGTVGRNAFIGGGEVVIGGTIHGIAEIRANRIVLLPTARIGGALRYSASQPIEIRAGAQIAGGTTQVPAPSRRRLTVGTALGPWLVLLRSIAEILALLVLGSLVVATTPQGAFTLIQEIQERFGRSLLAGFVLLVTVPAAALLLVFTVVAIPISVSAMLLYFATLYPGLALVAVWLGHTILAAVRKGSERVPSLYWSLLLGAVVLVFLFAIPFLGWVVRLLAIFLGFGALWLALWEAVTSRPGATEGQSPAIP